MTTNQQRFDNDDGTNERAERAQDFVAERIVALCDEHPDCEHRRECYCGSQSPQVAVVCLRVALWGGRESRCIYFADAVAARMKGGAL